MAAEAAGLGQGGRSSRCRSTSACSARFGRAVVTPPIYYRDIIEQFDSIGIGSLTVVLLAGLFTGMVLALNSGITLDQFGARSMVGRLISASMVKELGPVLTGLMVVGPRRLGHRGRARIDARHRSDRGAARARHRSDPQAGRAARARRASHDAAAERARDRHRHGRRLDRDGAAVPRRQHRLLDQRRRRASTCRTSGWGSSSRSSSASRS